MRKLKEVRLAKGLTQKQLADSANINIRVLQHYEQGTKNFDHARLETLLDIAAALGCRIADIVESEELKKKLNDAS